MKKSTTLTYTYEVFEGAIEVWIGNNHFTGKLRASFSQSLEIRLLCTNVPQRITQKIIDRF